MKDTLSLRDVNISEFNYSSHGLRPELEYASVESDFRQRLVSFLTRYTFADNIKALTSFSLPRGRQPAHLDEWIFLSFSSSKEGKLTLQTLQYFLKRTPKYFMNYLTQQRGTMKDSDELYDVDLDSAEGQITVKKASFPFGTSDFRKTVQNILDPHTVTVDNTSCASCHRLNRPSFNFHNLSKLENDRVNISTRVVNDVNYDLNWLLQLF